MPPKRKAATKKKSKREEEEISENEGKQEIESDEEQDDEEPQEKKAKPNTVVSGSKGDFGLAWKTVNGTLMVLDSASIPGSQKVVGFDMDDTLVTPKSGAKFPKNRSDWRWWDESVPKKLKELHKDGYKIVIFTNQAGIEKKKQSPKDIEGKILDLASALGFPIQAFVAAATDHHRKPTTFMWKYFVANCNGGVQPDLAQCTFVGDAAGRQKGWKAGYGKDFSCSDRGFALNIGIQFKTPEEFFLGEPTAAFEWESIDPQSALQQHQNKTAPKADEVISSDQEMVVMVGRPASGKSTFTKKYFVANGYVHVNMDTLKTKAKCLKAAREALEAGKSVVVDNTNPSAAARREFTSIAKDCGVKKLRCFVFQTDVELSHHLNFFREKQTNGAVRRIPDVGYNMFKSKYEEPTAKEGFSEIRKVEFVPDFADENERKLFLERT